MCQRVEVRCRMYPHVRLRRGEKGGERGGPSGGEGNMCEEFFQNSKVSCSSHQSLRER
jgi:hypothetical protein